MFMTADFSVFEIDILSGEIREISKIPDLQGFCRVETIL